MDDKSKIVEPVPEVVETTTFKSIFESKTIWVNFLAIIAFIIQQRFGFVIDEAIQVQILGVINIALRTITKDPVKWSK
jgi:hypothetical protein